MLRLKRAAPLILLTVPWFVACAEPASPEQCTQLLDRYVERLGNSDGREPSSEEILRLQREARARAAASAEFARCPEHVSKRQYECAMRANSADEIDRCLM